MKDRQVLWTAAGVLAIAMPLALMPPLQLRAQSPAPSTASPAFDVASVKPDKSEASPTGLVGGQRGGLTLTNLSVRQLIVKAYKLQDFQVVGGPNWIDSERFDIIAKTVGEPTADEKWRMLQALLSNRFGLRVHSEAREHQVYVLAVDRKDRRLGPNLRHSPAPCGVGAAMPCGGLAIGRFGDLSARSLPMSDFAGRALSFILGQTVRDGTGLTGNYDIDLKWMPDTNSAPPNGGSPDRPSIFTAVQEQLGLKLDSTKGPVDVLVIDHVEQPAPD